ncbi:hypothetical protein O181_071997 [Austropuccinia psidii MF-1]|uniref:Uncharacterized protein n=1 Tax=Austropuccinia psidii MF-1 TaxID=1389203 RepID=A0A9Q3F692_9BASI|nr:hypothetical protein [Austropuccinia psidii MF-1]
MLPTPLILTLAECTPDMLPTPLTILTLCTPNTTYPYACVVPSQHAPNTAVHPYAWGGPSPHAPNTTYPYACVVPSQHAPDTAYHPMLAECPPNMLLTPLILTLPSYIHSVRWLVGVHDERNCRNMLSGLLCQQDLRENWSVYSQCCG